eukprot:629320-Amphidinium_carterae.1
MKAIEVDSTSGASAVPSPGTSPPGRPGTFERRPFSMMMFTQQHCCHLHNLTKSYSCYEVNAFSEDSGEELAEILLQKPSCLKLLRMESFWVLKAALLC